MAHVRAWRSGFGLCCLPLAALSLAPAAVRAVELEGVTITAQKEPRDGRDVPLSVAVLDGAALRERDVITADDLSRYAGNAYITQQQIYVRGIGTGNTFGFDPSVAVYADGVYLGRATAVTGLLWDLEQAELVRGPQGALLGKNTIGGALLLTTPPAGRAFGGYAKARCDTLGACALRGAADLPVAEALGLRLSFFDSGAGGGYVRNTTLGTDDLGRGGHGLRLRADLHPADRRLSAWLTLEDGESRLRGFASQLSAATPASLALFRLYDARTEADLGDGRAAYDTPGTGARRQAQLATLNLAFQPGGWTFRSLSSVAGSTFDYRFDADYSAVPLLAVDIGEHYRQWSEELRAAHRQGALGFVAGAAFLHADLAVGNTTTALPQGAAALIPAALPPSLAGLLAADPLQDRSLKHFDQSADSLSLFTDAEWTPLPRLTLTAGLRWTREAKDVAARLAFARSGLLFRAALGEQPYDIRCDRREQGVAPRLALQYRGSPQTTAYLLAAAGGKGGGFNDFAPRPDRFEYAPERSRTLELGVKHLDRERRFTLDLDVFETQLRDLQVTAYDGTAFYVRNAASTRARGAELEARWRHDSGFAGRASVGWLDSRYRSFADAPARADQSADRQDLSGRPTVRAPRVSGGAGVEYRGALGAALQWHASLDALFRSRSFLNLDDDPLDAQPAVTVWNAGLGIGSRDGRWELRAVGENLGDALLIAASGDQPLFAGNHAAEVEAPRRFALTLELSF